MKRAWQAWLLYAVCLAVALPVLAWLTVAALRLERAEGTSRQHAKREEKIRLASWRLDTLLMPIIAPEAARSYDDYQRLALHPSGPPVGVTPPPSQYVLSYFEISPDAAMYSHPDSPLSYAELVSQLPQERLKREDPTSEANLAAVDRGVKWIQQQAVPLANGQQSGQQAAGQFDDDFLRRQQSNVKNTVRELAQQRAAKAAPRSLEVQEGVSRPVFSGDELLVARRVTVDGRELVQGCRLDWNKLQGAMRDEVADLLPDVKFVPVRDASGVNFAHALATLPVQLVVPKIQAASAGWTPLRVALAVGWAGLVVGALAAAALVAGVVSLSQRREAFVSAVTHELRTPLTTFRMYSEMLDAGMVADERQRKQYVGTLHREANRLWHLVENVLAYARLERGRAAHKQECLTVAELWSRTQPRLAERARQARMELALDLDAAAYSVSLATDPAAVEQILFNLVDNACKYAAGAATRTIHVQATADTRRVQIRVRDHGAGIRPSQTRQLFRPFSKSADQAARSAPGVGLGLALSRRLARQMGGDLRYEAANGEGATFLLTLRRG
jgi:signal transduction histidine kinase